MLATKMSFLIAEQTFIYHMRHIIWSELCSLYRYTQAIRAGRSQWSRVKDIILHIMVELYALRPYHGQKSGRQ